MGEESGVPVGLFFVLLYSEEKKIVNEEEGVYIAVLFTSPRSKGGEKEELQDIGIYTLLSQILTFEYKKSVGLSCL